MACGDNWNTIFAKIMGWEVCQSKSAPSWRSYDLLHDYALSDASIFSCVQMSVCHVLISCLNVLHFSSVNISVVVVRVRPLVVVRSVWDRAHIVNGFTSISVYMYISLFVTIISMSSTIRRKSVFIQISQKNCVNSLDRDSGFFAKFLYGLAVISTVIKKIADL